MSDKPPPNTVGQRTTNRTNETATPAVTHGPDWHKIQQIVKWLIYALLIVNFVFYIIEDSGRAAFTLHAGSTFLDWTSAFATSIDLTAWFLLLAMFEIETYVLEDEDLTGRVAIALHGVRLVCYALLAHTVYAFVVVVSSLQPTIAVEEDPVVTDMKGLSLERNLALADLAEAVLWLLVILAIEVVVRLQGHGVSGGNIILTAIEMNLSEWRDEIDEQQVTTQGTVK